MQKIEGKQYTVIIPDTLIQKVDHIAKRTDRTRADTMRILMDLGADIFKDFESVGLIRLAEIVTRTKKAISKEAGQQSLFEA